MGEQRRTLPERDGFFGGPSTEIDVSSRTGRRHGEQVEHISASSYGQVLREQMKQRDAERTQRFSTNRSPSATPCSRVPHVVIPDRRARPWHHVYGRWCCSSQRQGW